MNLTGNTVPPAVPGSSGSHSYSWGDDPRDIPKALCAAVVAGVSFYGYSRNRSVVEALALGGVGAVSVYMIAFVVKASLPGRY